MSKWYESKFKERITADEAYFLKSTSLAYFIICHNTILWNVGVSILLFI